MGELPHLSLPWPPAYARQRIGKRQAGKGGPYCGHPWLTHARTGGGAADPWNSWTRMTVLIDGEPWFVAKDVCEVLGIAKHRDAISDLDDDEIPY